MSASRAARLVRRELLASLGDLARLPAQALAYRLSFAAQRAELESRIALPDVRCPAPPAARARTPARRLFFSCAEASGQIHLLSLLEALRAAGEPLGEWSALGGPELEARGLARVGDPVARAAMGLSGVRAQLPFYLELLTRTAEHLERTRPEAVVLVDSPALHVPLGGIARRLGLRVLHYVAPQYWGWAPWRIERYRRSVDLCLCLFPFEAGWFEARGLRAAHVGHPLLDTLPPALERAPQPGRLALLPGSRAGVLARNLPWMLAAAAELRARRPELEVEVLQQDGRQRAAIERELARWPALGARYVEGQLHAALARASAAFSVSGTVLLDLLHHRLPTVVIYRLAHGLELELSKRFLTAPYFAAPNLLAGRAILPEHCFHGAGPQAAVVDELERALFDAAWRRRCERALDGVALRLGGPGASARAAGWVRALADGSLA